MTVAAKPATISYIEDGVSVSFAVPFRFKAASDLVVERVIDGVASVLKLNVDYSVDGGATDAGGTLTRKAATSGAMLRIRRNTARIQPMRYDTGDRFPAASHEEALDRATLVDQEQQDQIDETEGRALLAPIGQALKPLDGHRPGRFVGFGADPDQPLMLDGGGADPLLRQDLANPAVGAKVVSFQGRSLDDKLIELPSVTDVRFAGGAVPDCVYDAATDTIASGTDSTAAFQAAFAAGKPFVVPPGWYRVSHVAVEGLDSPTMIMHENAWIVAQPPRYNGTQVPFISAFLFMYCVGPKVIGASKYGCGLIVQGASEANGISMVHCGGGEVIRSLSIIKGNTPDIALKDDTFQTAWTILNAIGGNPNNLQSNASVIEVFSDGFAQYGSQFYGDLSGGVALRNTYGPRTGRPDQPISHGCAMAITRGVGPLLVADNDMGGQKEFAILGSSAGKTSRDVTIRNNRLDDCGRGSVSWTEEADLASVPGQGTVRLTIASNSCTGTGKGQYTSGFAAIRAGSYDGVGFIDGLSIYDNELSDNTDFDILVQSNAAQSARVQNVTIMNNRRQGGARIQFSLAIAAGVFGARHLDTYVGDETKNIFDMQSYFYPLQLEGDFTNILGAEYTAPSYMTRPENGVKPWGRVDGTPGLTIATLPPGVRPPYNIAFGGGGMGRGSVRTDGRITADVGPGPWDLSAIPSFFPYAK